MDFDLRGDVLVVIIEVILSNLPLVPLFTVRYATFGAFLIALLFGEHLLMSRRFLCLYSLV